MDAPLAKRRKKPVTGLAVATKQGRRRRLDLFFGGNHLFNPADFGLHCGDVGFQILDIPALHISRHRRWFELFKFVFHHTPCYMPHATCQPPLGGYHCPRSVGSLLAK